MKCGYELLNSFEKSKIFDQIILPAEKILVECIFGKKKFRLHALWKVQSKSF